MSSGVRFTDFKSDKQPTWCPGCGDFGMMSGIMKALVNSDTDPDNTFMVAGIGYSGKIGTYMHSHAIHGVHGRPLPVAAGVRLAGPDLTIVAAGGDGDGCSIGADHSIHAVRRNVDMAYTVMDNRICGLTKGQASPTLREDFETSTTSERPQQPPVNPLMLSLAAGGTFIAQSFATDHKRHTEIVREAVEHDGFGFANVFNLCVTFSDVDTYDYFHDNLVDLVDTDHDPTDYDAAKEKILDSSEEYRDVIYKDKSSVSYEEKFGVDQDVSDVSSGAPDDAINLVHEFY